MRTRRRIGLLMVALAAAAAPARGGEAWRLVSVETAPAPEPLLPQELLRPGAPVPARLGVGITGGGPWQHRLCTDPSGARERLLGGLREATAGGEPAPEVRRAYYALLQGCPERAPEPAHARWLLAAAEGEPAGPARDLLYRVLARVHPLRAPAAFEQAGVPDDAVVAYHARRSGDDARVHSARLAEIVARRLADGEPRELEDAARAYAKLDHSRVVPAFEELLERAPEGSLQGALWRALRESPRPEGRAIFARHCSAWLADAEEAWRARGAPLRGSPTRFGNPCSRDRWLRGREASREKAPPPPRCAFVSWATPWPRARPGACIMVPPERGMRFQGDAELLRRLTRWLRPHLDGVDGAVFAERWPAVEAVGLDHGPLRIPVHVRGDGVSVRVPRGAGGDPDLDFARELERALDEALDGERRIDAHMDGTRRRYAFASCGERWCADLAVGVLNELLEARRAPVRLRRDPAPDVLRLHVASAKGGSG